jgi:hypothetical protein
VHQEVVVAGVFKSITAPSPRALPGTRHSANNGDYDLPPGAGGEESNSDDNSNNNNIPEQPSDDGEVEIDPRGNGKPNRPPRTEQQLRKERERAEKARQREVERARKIEEKERKRREKQAEILRRQQQQAMQQQVPQVRNEAGRRASRAVLTAVFCASVLCQYCSTCRSRC